MAWEYYAWDQLHARRCSGHIRHGIRPTIGEVNNLHTDRGVDSVDTVEPIRPDEQEEHRLAAARAKRHKAEGGWDSQDGSRNVWPAEQKG